MADASYNFLTIEPTFTILKPELAEPIMKEFVEKTRTEKGCLYYGWSKCDDKLFCREAYVDGDAVLAHLGNVGPCIDALLKESAKLERISIHGPQAELDKVKPATEALGTKYYAVDSGFANVTKDPADEPGAQDLVAIMPHFNIKDWDAAKPIMEEFVTKTRTEAGCTYYGWTKTDASLVCREAYKNGEAVLAHLDNVGACIGKLLDGPGELAEISIHGPQAELDKVKAATEKLGTKYFAYHSGFARILYVK